MENNKSEKDRGAILGEVARQTGMDVTEVKPGMPLAKLGLTPRSENLVKAVIVGGAPVILSKPGEAIIADLLK